MKKWYIIFFLVLVTQFYQAQAKEIMIQDISWTTADEGKAKLVLTTNNGQMLRAPEWNVSGNKFNLNLYNAKTSKTLNKTVSGMVQLKVNNVAQNQVTVEAIFPQNNTLNLENTTLNLKQNLIEITAPIKMSTHSTTVIKVEKPKTEVKAETKDQPILDETYLKKLEGEVQLKTPEVVAVSEASVTQKAPTVAKSQEVVFNPHENNIKSPKNTKSNFSMVNYAGKFIAFLGVVLLIFYGAVQLMKKGFLGKGKMAFINGQQLVSVISTTYISPKKSLLLIKAHQQIFLVAQTEQGMQLISEIKDFPGMMKETEKVMTGNNFDMDMDGQSDNVSNVKMKDNIYASTPVEDKKAVKDVVKFSEQIKKKMKTLKSLQ